MSGAYKEECPQVRGLGISARAADGDIMAALREVVEHQIIRGTIPPERLDHAVGWCFSWLAESDPRILQRYCVHVQAVAAVADYPHTIPGEDAANV